MSRIFVLGSMNTDFSICCDKMPMRGETVVGRDFFISSGGKGANQAVAATKLGGSAVMLGAVGNDIFAEKIIKSISDYGVDARYIQKKNVSTGVAIITIENNDNRIIIDGGANNLVVENDFRQILIDNAEKGDILVTQLEIPIETVSATLETAKSIGMITILNPAPAKKLSENIYKYCDYLIPNETEAAILSGISVIDTNYQKIRNYFIKLGVKNVIITLGKDGCVFCNKEEIRHLAAIPVKVADTIAAGDTFIGAYATALTEGKDDAAALNFSLRASALTVTKHGAQQSIPTKSELDNFKG
ncbi:MAG: ribokinase [Clostridia bacterium]|nr:ribokinase [Clostridia bacterium]